MAGLLANAPTVHCILDSGQRTQYLSRLAPYPSHKPSIYPAWRPPANPGFIPLGACPQTQRLSRLAPACKPSIYPAWRLPANPVFIPLGACPQTPHLSRLAPRPSHKSRFYPAWRLFMKKPCIAGRLSSDAGLFEAVAQFDGAVEDGVVRCAIRINGIVAKTFELVHGARFRR